MMMSRVSAAVAKQCDINTQAVNQSNNHNGLRD